MRVITGIARGRTLQTLQGADVRPTTDRVKEAVFSILQFELEGRRILDLFSGSGQLGIEALSRGAKNAVFIDSNAEAFRITKENVAKCGFEKSSVILNTDSLTYITNAPQSEMFDIVFLDPPYNNGSMERALPAAAQHTSAGGVIVCETPAGQTLMQEAGNFCISKEYKYGNIKITLYRSKDVAQCKK